MSTRQRLTHETAGDPPTGGSLVLARAVDSGTSLIEDIAARRLRELSQRLSAPEMVALPADNDSELAKTDAEFEPVSLAAIIALGRQQTPDAPGDSIVEAAETPRLLVAIPAAADVPPSEPPRADSHIEPATLPVPVVALEPAEPIRLTGEAPSAFDEAPPPEPTDQVPPVSMADGDAQPAENQPLLLADQSTTDIRLVDLIRRQQSLLDQLNSFPPSYVPPPDEVTEIAPEAPAEAPRSVIEQLAPPPAATPLEVREVREETPPPPPRKDTLREPPRLASPVARQSTDEPAAIDLPQQSPKIIQRARAERSIRRPPVAAPPSAVPAFLAGLAAALVVAGVLFVIL